MLISLPPFLSRTPSPIHLSESLLRTHSSSIQRNADSSVLYIDDVPHHTTFFRSQRAKEQYNNRVARNSPSPTNVAEDEGDADDAEDGPVVEEPREPCKPGEEVRLRLPMHSIMYEGEPDRDVKRGKWVDPGLLPDNHFSTPTDVRYRPSSRDDFLTYWQEKGGEYRAQPRNMYRHEKMRNRLEGVADSMTAHHDKLVTTRKTMLALQSSGECSRQETIVMNEIIRKYVANFRIHFVFG